MHKVGTVSSPALYYGALALLRPCFVLQDHGQAGNSQGTNGTSPSSASSGDRARAGGGRADRGLGRGNGRADGGSASGRAHSRRASGRGGARRVDRRLARNRSRTGEVSDGRRSKGEGGITAARTRLRDGDCVVAVGRVAASSGRGGWRRGFYCRRQFRRGAV